MLSSAELSMVLSSEFIVGLDVTLGAGCGWLVENVARNSRSDFSIVDIRLLIFRGSWRP